MKIVVINNILDILKLHKMNFIIKTTYYIIKSPSKINKYYKNYMRIINKLLTINNYIVEIYRNKII